MNYEELRIALLEKSPVSALISISAGHKEQIDFKCVNAVISKNENGKFVTLAELLDKNGLSVVRVPAENVKRR